MYDTKSIQQKINNLMIEINCYINFLYTVSNIYTKCIILNQLRDKFLTLNFLLDLVDSNPKIPAAANIQTQINKNANQTFTLEELSKYNGKNGNPAYTAVNGVVYDVTNNAAWAAGTHFGLTAGKDLTNEFQSCHAGQQQILNELKVVGKLV